MTAICWALGIAVVVQSISLGAVALICVWPMRQGAGEAQGLEHVGGDGVLQAQEDDGEDGPETTTAQVGFRRSVS